MTSCVGSRATRRSRLVAVAATVLILFDLASAGLAAPAGAAPAMNQCAPAGLDSASVLPKDLIETHGVGQEDDYTTASVEPLSRVNVGALGLSTPGILTVGTLSDAPPNICIDPAGQFSGFDNQLLRAIANKLGLQLRFFATDFSGLLAQVASRRFDVGSSAIKATDARRRTVTFTNGYDFGYYSLIVPAGSAITKFSDLGSDQRIGVVQGTVEESYVVDTLHLQPVKYPGFATLYASLKMRQLDAWVAPATLASTIMRPGDPVVVVANAFSPGNFIAYAVAQGNQPLVDALNAGLDAVIADGTWANLYSQWVPRTPPPGLETRVKSCTRSAAAGFRRDRGEPKSQAHEPGSAEVAAGTVAPLILRLGYVSTSHPHSAHHGAAQHHDSDQQCHRHRTDTWHGVGHGRDVTFTVAALAGAGVHRYLSGSSRAGDHSAHRPGGRPTGERVDAQQPLPAWHCRFRVDGGRLHGRNSAFGYSKHRPRPTRSRSCAWIQLPGLRCGS